MYCFQLSLENPFIILWVLRLATSLRPSPCKDNGGLLGRVGRGKEPRHHTMLRGGPHPALSCLIDPGAQTPLSGESHLQNGATTEPFSSGCCEDLNNIKWSVPTAFSVKGGSCQHWTDGAAGHHGTRLHFSMPSFSPL